MGETKVTKMLIKVDLQCARCYKKIKKILCCIPQIRDQVYDEKANTVLITVVCCSPEKIKQKICCKGGDMILGIAIIPDKSKPKPDPTPNPAPIPNPNPAPTPIPNPNPRPTPIPNPGPPPHAPGICCCQPCYEGYRPCYPNYARLPPRCYDGCGRPAYECQGGNRSYSVCRCDYFSDENPSACTIM